MLLQEERELLLSHGAILVAVERAELLRDDLRRHDLAAAETAPELVGKIETSQLSVPSVQTPNFGVLHAA